LADDSPSFGVRRLANRPGYGDTAQRVVSYAWETTPLRAIDTWPEQLQLLVQVMLTSAFPMMLVWGREYTQVYNDAFRPILGSEKHPKALGESARETWAEIWDEIGPLFATVFDSGEPVRAEDQRLLIDRNGYSEETFFTYSYGPIHDQRDTVVGLLVVASETTSQLVDRRRLSALGALAAALVSAKTIESVAKASVDALKDCPSLPALEINLIVAERAVRIASFGPPLTGADEREFVRKAATEPTPVVLDDDWKPGLPARRVAFGIDDPKLQTVVVAGLNPNRAFDEDYQQFIRLIRQTIGASMTAALLHSAELGELRLISDTLQHAMLDLASDLPTVAARYIPKSSNLTVGGDWYEVVDLGHGRRALIVGDCVGHGLEAATAMGALRNVSRALLSEGRGPAEVITSLHHFATATPAAFCATVVCAIVDLEAQTITYSNAGHLPPLLVHNDNPLWLGEALSTPLAVGDPARTEARIDVRPGDLLVLYTDGLVERPGEHLDEGLERLRNAVLARRNGSVQQIAEHLVEQLVDASPRDDIALVVKRIH
jgi:serine phosphatase RsbU (regulator of sigma subunit)